MTVNQSLTGVTVTPATATVVTNGTQHHGYGGGPVRQHDRLSDVYVGGERGRDDLFCRDYSRPGALRAARSR